MKKTSAALVCVALLVANLVKYWPEGVGQASPVTGSVAGESPVGEVVGFGRSYRIGAVDLFAIGPGVDGESGLDQAQSESAGRETGPDTAGDRGAGQPAADPGETLRRPARKTGFELLSVAEIAGVKKGLVKYGGKHYFISSGDVIDGKYVVQRIDDKKIYLKSVAGSGSQ
ncbi:hypothetical protein [Microbulbifer sp.]|uniref:hypothetical protein n=1 Tax=Microbulbifer sp. TaxID=1908541 RepID=UPI003F301E73